MRKRKNSRKHRVSLKSPNVAFFKRWIKRRRENKSDEEQRNTPKSIRLPDRILVILIVFLLVFGLIMVFDASVVFSYAYFGDKYKFIVQQLLWTGVGAALMGFTYFLPYKYYKVLTVPLLVVTVGLLGAVIMFSQEVAGAQRWLDLGSLTFQPSELAKLTYIIYIAVWLAKDRKFNTWKEYLKIELIPFLLTTGVVSGMVIAGNDMSTAFIILIISFLMYFLAAKTKLQKRGIILTLGLGTLAAILFVVTKPYRFARVEVFWSLLKGEILNPTTSGFQIYQILIAIGSGGWFGNGFTKSLQKYDLVETTAATDSIFAIIGEEFGFFICLALIGLYLAITLRGLRIAEKTKNPIGSMLAAGVAVWIGVQAFINIGANVGLIPLTGVPLPLVSYGGSALVTLMAALGILLNISKDAANDNGSIDNKPTRKSIRKRRALLSLR